MPDLVDGLLFYCVRTGIFIAWQLFDALFQPLFTMAMSLLDPDVSCS